MPRSYRNHINQFVSHNYIYNVGATPLDREGSVELAKLMSPHIKVILRLGFKVEVRDSANKFINPNTLVKDLTDLTIKIWHPADEQVLQEIELMHQLVWDVCPANTFKFYDYYNEDIYEDLYASCIRWFYTLSDRKETFA